MKKLISLILALVLLCSLIPLSASAVTIKWPFGPNGLGYVLDDNGNVIGTLKPGETWQPEDEKEEEKDTEVKPEHDPDEHAYGWEWDMKYHWMECACGSKRGYESHVDPLETEDDYCFCGKHFSSNADLVTLWIQGSYGIKNFNKNVTEYKIKGHTYKDFKDVRIATKTAHCGATVELPENRDINEGENVFVVKVTAENKKVTKTYTVTVVKDGK